MTALCTLLPRPTGYIERESYNDNKRPVQLIECPRPNLNQISFDTQIWKQKSRSAKKIGFKGVQRSQIPVTRGEGKENFGFALLSSPGATVTHQGSQGSFSVGQKRVLLTSESNFLHLEWVSASQ